MKERRREKRWKGMPVLIKLCDVRIVDMVVTINATGYIKPEVKTLLRKKVKILGREVTLFVTSSLGEEKCEILDEKGRIIYICQERGYGRIGHELLGLKRRYMSWEARVGNFLMFLDKLSDKERENGISEERFMQLVPPQIGRIYVERYRSFFRKYFGQDRVVKKTKEACHQAH